MKDEELFAEKYSPNMWYPLGVVLSESATTAQEAARLAKVQWKVRAVVFLFSSILRVLCVVRLIMCVLGSRPAAADY